MKEIHFHTVSFIIKMDFNQNMLYYLNDCCENIEPLFFSNSILGECQALNQGVYKALIYHLFPPESRPDTISTFMIYKNRCYTEG